MARERCRGDRASDSRAVQTVDEKSQNPGAICLSSDWANIVRRVECLSPLLLDDVLDQLRRGTERANATYPGRSGLNGAACLAKDPPATARGAGL